MDTNMIMVESQSDMTLVVNVPDLPLNKIWKKRGAKLPIDRGTLVQAFYEPSVEYLFLEGLLTTDDKQFLTDVGLLIDDGEKQEVVVKPLTKTKLNRLIKLMPVAELKTELEKLTVTQLEELASYCVDNYQELKLDRVELISKATGKNIMKAIENFKAEQED